MNEREIKTVICPYCKMDVDENWIHGHYCEEKEKAEEKLRQWVYFAAGVVFGFVVNPAWFL